MNKISSKRYLRSGFIIVIIVIFLFFLIEGFFSIIYVISSFKRPLTERLFTKYDPRIGWVNVPNAYVKDVYGPHIDVRINSQGFRNKEEFLFDNNNAKRRIFCSGDSFTFGWGVQDKDTWCQALSAKDTDIQTINGGVSGYGLDQMYLAYLDKGVHFRKNIHIVALIGTDILGRFNESFLGYAKPYFTIKEGLLVLRNVPVPRASFVCPVITENLRHLVKLRSVESLGKFFDRHGSKKNTISNVKYDPNVALMILKEIKRLDEKQGVVLVVVYLPTLGELQKPVQAYNQLRAGLSSELKKQDILFLDLFDEFIRLDEGIKQRMFKGHLSVEGNHYVASLIYQKLVDNDLLNKRQVPNGLN